MDTRWLRFIRRSARRTKRRIEGLQTEIRLKEQMMADQIEQLRRLRAENTKLRRENHELIESENLLMRDNRALAQKHATEQAKRVVAEDEAKRWASTAGQLAGELVKARQRDEGRDICFLPYEHDRPFLQEILVSFAIETESKRAVACFTGERPAVVAAVKSFFRNPVRQHYEPQRHGDMECGGK